MESRKEADQNLLYGSGGSCIVDSDSSDMETEGVVVGVVCDRVGRGLSPCIPAECQSQIPFRLEASLTLL